MNMCKNGRTKNVRRNIFLITHLIQCVKSSVYDHKTTNIAATRNTNSVNSPPGGPGEVPGSCALCTWRTRIVAREKESSLLQTT